MAEGRFVSYLRVSTAIKAPLASALMHSAPRSIATSTVADGRLSASWSRSRAARKPTK